MTAERKKAGDIYGRWMDWAAEQLNLHDLEIDLVVDTRSDYATYRIVEEGSAKLVAIFSVPFYLDIQHKTGSRPNVIINPDYEIEDLTKIAAAFAFGVTHIDHIVGLTKRQLPESPDDYFQKLTSIYNGIYFNNCGVAPDERKLQ